MIFSLFILFKILQKQLCAGGAQGQDSCSGDSGIAHQRDKIGRFVTSISIKFYHKLGGPLMAEDKSNPINPYVYLAGVVSFGPSQCGTKGFPGVYTVRAFFQIHLVQFK